MAVGDILIHQEILEAAYDPATGQHRFARFFDAMVPLFRKADIVVGNLETTLSGPAIGYRGYPRFNSPDSLAYALRDVGFDVLVTANNHAADHGPEGIARTLRVLDRAGIRHVGTARSRKERDTPLLIERNGIVIALLAYSYGTNCQLPLERRPHLLNLIDVDRIEADAERARASAADLVVALLHVGTEYAACPDDAEIALVASLHARGIDAVLGCHPHIVQPARRSRDGSRFAMYSMGNFFSNQRGACKDIGVVVDLHVEKTRGATTIKRALFHSTYVHKRSLDGVPDYAILPMSGNRAAFGDLHRELMQHIRGPVRRA